MQPFNLQYSFDDETVVKFCYDRAAKRIDLHFSAYYDLSNNDAYIERECVLTIESWTRAMVAVGNEKRRSTIETQMGIVDLITSISYLPGNELEMQALTLENRYLTITFEGASLWFA